MPRPLIPPGRPETVPARRTLVLAPHYDDEVLGCGGLILDLLRRDVEVRVLFLTDGRGTAEQAAEDVEAHIERRRKEARDAAEVLGVTGIEELLLPDGALPQHLGELGAALRTTLVEYRPDLLLTPSPLEASTDHRATFAAVHQILGGLRRDVEDDRDLLTVAAGLRVLLWEANRLLFADVLVDVGAHLDVFERAMSCYESQEALHPYLRAARGLLQYRALSLEPGVRAAEAYRSLHLDDFRTRGPAALVAHLGGTPDLVVRDDGPWVSIIVRTKDRPDLLRQALDSLGCQTYRRLEVVVVNDGGRSPAVGNDHGIPQLRRIDLVQNLGRGGAANAGVDEARGDYVGFLDDDDLVEPDHVETLVAAIAAPGVRVAYSDAAVSVLELQPDHGDRGWVEVERRLPYSRDFDPDLLMVDNYLPFNTLLVERGLFASAGPFDTGLEFFEDWEFLLRLAGLTPFHHIRRVTCEYRHFRGPGHHILGGRPREHGEFLTLKAQVIERHLESLEGAERVKILARVVDRLRAECVEAEEAAKAEGAHRVEAERRFHRANGRLDALTTHQRVLEGIDERRSAEVAGLRQRLAAELGRRQDLERQLKTRDGELADAYAELGRLDTLIRDMQATRAWRLHRKVQSWKGE